MSSPLDGVRILDLTQVQAGPSCTQLLAWMGADVIKVEQPGVGDRTRTERAVDPDVDSFYFIVFNANKRSICLDLRADAGREALIKLVALSDVVVENYGPGQMERFGLGYDVLREANPKIVYCTIKGYGTYGPNASIKCFEHIAQAMGGAMSANGEAGGSPQFVAPGVGDSGSGLHAAIGMLAALRQRDNTGEAQRVEISMQDAIVNLMRIRMIDTLNTHEPVPRVGNRVWGGPPFVYPCAPGGPNDYVALVLAGDGWDSVLALAGRAELVGDERFATNEARIENAVEVEEIVTSWTMTKTKHEIMDILAKLGIPVGAVQDTLEVFGDEHLKAREMIIDMHDPARGDYKIIGCPIKIESNELEIKPPPLLGEHSEDVLSSLLDMGSAEIAALKSGGVI
ncbi:MAG: formyl-CoA transferase [SAR202 cluster bacterium]|nr:formyl-CoA transferase [Chloroflexota bacterium]MDP6422099.1 CoA transferase [SAR202 cluster bacterium]MDP6798779.1 CoA transferase [SAR202 cluster bacterium]MQG69752.1 formyl-CoA transferase [SAR202 cluster bacterium]HAL46990.1 formyl-CoA transferase [Dehalococcoidia bacterium]